MRVALIIGSTLAAMIVSGALAWFIRDFDSEPALQGAVWIVHFRITLPAMIAVALSAAFHTRGTRAADCPDATLSARITWWSFPVFGMLLALMQFIEAVVLADATAGYVGGIMMNMAAIFVITMIASIFLFILAFFAEFVVIRFLRASRLRALISGVVP